jgi:hypothetical protein
VHYELDNEAGVLAAEECFRRLVGGDKFDKLMEDARREARQETQP